MSRIGKLPVVKVDGVTVTIDGQKVTAKGPKGELKLPLRPEVTVAIEGAKVKVGAVSEEREQRAFQGTTRALIASMVEGVSKGYEKKLEVSGVGYQAVLEGKKLALSLGFNKPVKFDIPATVVVEVPNPTTILIKGCDKQQVGVVAGVALGCGRVRGGKHPAVTFTAEESGGH